MVSVTSARVESEHRSLLVPDVPQRLAVDLALGGARHKRRALHEALVRGRAVRTALVRKRTKEAVVLIGSPV